MSCRCVRYLSPPPLDPSQQTGFPEGLFIRAEEDLWELRTDNKQDFQTDHLLLQHVGLKVLTPFNCSWFTEMLTEWLQRILL